MEQKRAVWVAEVEDRGALVRLVRAALLRNVAPVQLEEPHLAPGPHILQIRLRGEPVVVLAAELAGETATGSYALHLAPLDPSHEPELVAIAAGEEPVPASLGPISASGSAIFDSEPPLEEAALQTPMRRFAKTMPDPEPLHDDDDDDLAASVLFDPEAALIGRAPARPVGTGPEDSLTIPLRSSVMPGPPAPARASQAPAPPKPPFSGPHTISHLSFPSSMPAPSERHPMRERQGSVTDTSISIQVDLSLSDETDPNTQRLDWDDAAEGAAALDPSLQASVLFDPEVRAREQRVDARTEHPAESESYSVVFGNEATSPGSGRERALGVVVSHHEDLSLTPTMPMDVPPRRRPSFRRDPNQIVSEDGETVPNDSQSQPGSGGAAISSTPSRGPRTMKRTGSHGMIAVGRVIANRYRIESLVGAGAVGAVYMASHVELPRTFAIKVLHPHYRTDPHLLTSFRTEARAASLLDHPNVTVVHDFGEEPDGLVYIVMEYLAGDNLQKILDEERRLTPRRAIDIMLQVCAALSAAHDRGIIHRDVKPDNIMLVPARDDEGRTYELVKVCDFGIAALESTPDAADEEWTAGTPEYMAPEQAAGRADQRTDVYACGIVLYEMLTGRPPFVGDSPVATLAKHATEQARRPSEIMPGLPLPLEAVILRAIEKDPERRFATMRALRAELKRLL